MHVAETALAALGDDYPLFIFRKIRDDLACGKVLDDSSYRDPDNEILSVPAVHLAVAALDAVLCHELMLEAEVLQARKARRGLENDITAVAAVTAVGTAVGYVLLRMEA
jgi:hypothetical protein